MKKLVMGIIIGIMLSVTVNAAVEYNLNVSECKIVVDGKEVKDEKLPLLLMEPGYNYAPVAVLRDICGTIGVGFEFDAPTKEVRITTTKEEKIVSTETIEPAKVEYVEPATIEVDGIKKAFVGDINALLKPYGYKLKASGYGDDKLKLCDKNDSIVFMNIPYTVHSHNNQGGVFIEYSFYEQNIKPLITQ